MLIYWFSSTFRMGDALPGQGRSPMGLQSAGQGSSSKRTFLQGLQPAGQGSSPKRTFSWCWLVCLCHVIKTKKIAEKLEKALTFQTETNILHHYKGILLLKLLWQNQNYQLVFWVGVGIDPSGSGSLPSTASPTWTETQIPRDQSDRLPPKPHC